MYREHSLLMAEPSAPCHLEGMVGPWIEASPPRLWGGNSKAVMC